MKKIVLIFLFVTSALYLGKDLFYIDSLLFVSFYLFMIELVKWGLLSYVELVLQIGASRGFVFHIFYLLLQVVTGVALFSLFDRVLIKEKDTTLVT